MITTSTRTARSGLAPVRVGAGISALLALFDIVSVFGAGDLGTAWSATVIVLGGLTLVGAVPAWRGVRWGIVLTIIARSLVLVLTVRCSSP